MNLHTLLIFRTVADEGSFRRAAERLFLSQPAVSQQVASLEKEYGVRLFDRKGRSIALTPEGRALHLLAIDLLRKAEEIPGRFREMKALRSGRIHIAVSPFAGRHILPGPVRDFAADFPAVSLSVHAGLPAQIAEDVKRGTAELGVLGRNFLESRDPDLTYRTLGKDPLVMAAAPSHPLFRHAPPHPLTTDEETLIRFSRNCQPVDHVEEFLLREGVRFGAAIEVNEIDMANSLAREGAGIAITSHLSILRDIEDGTLAVVPFPHMEDLHWEIQCFFSSYRGLSHAGWEITKRIESHCHRILQSAVPDNFPGSH